MAEGGVLSGPLLAQMGLVLVLVLLVLLLVVVLSRGQQQKCVHPFQLEVPRAAVFLESLSVESEAAAGKHGGVPHSLRANTMPSGLKYLDARFWLDLDPARVQLELGLKRRLLWDDAALRRQHSAIGQGGETLRVEQLVLEMVVADLNLHHPGHLVFRDGMVTVAAGGGTYPFQALATTQPLLLASLLVQEDLILLRKAKDEEEYTFESGHAAFSFVELGLNGERGFMLPGCSRARKPSRRCMDSTRATPAHVRHVRHCACARACAAGLYLSPPCTQTHALSCAPGHACLGRSRPAIPCRQQAERHSHPGPRLCAASRQDPDQSNSIARGCT